LLLSLSLCSPGPKVSSCLSPAGRRSSPSRGLQGAWTHIKFYMPLCCRIGLKTKLPLSTFLSWPKSHLPVPRTKMCSAQALTDQRTPPPPQSYLVARNFTAAAVGSPSPSLLRCGQWFKEPPVNGARMCRHRRDLIADEVRAHASWPTSGAVEPLQPSGLLCLVAGDRLHAVRVLLCSESYRGKSLPWMCSFALLNLFIIFCLASLC
jgi:hypothetical protein